MRSRSARSTSIAIASGAGIICLKHLPHVTCLHKPTAYSWLASLDNSQQSLYTQLARIICRMRRHAGHAVARHLQEHQCNISSFHLGGCKRQATTAHSSLLYRDKASAAAKHTHAKAEAKIRSHKQVSTRSELTEVIFLLKSH